jgi:peptidoglycan-associated lipoprotein
LGVSPGISERCKLPETRAESPQFDFDDSELRPRGMNILDGIAACMQEGGALARQSVTVVGHADPRGTEDYNRGLGMRRADAARRYLESKGIPASRVNVRTRGEAEAKGTDVSGWQLDRHVEIEEANSPRR